MKRTTILIYKDITAPKRGLKQATQEEWNAILQSNKGLPMCERRCFIEDSFEDCGVIDRMFIEVPYLQYLSWHKEKMAQQRNCEAGKCYPVFSLNHRTSGEGSDELQESIPDSYDLELAVTDEIMLETIRKALSTWRPWAVEMFEIMLEPKEMGQTRRLAEENNVSEQIIRKRKRELANYLKKYL